MKYMMKAVKSSADMFSAYSIISSVIECKYVMGLNKESEMGIEWDLRKIQEQRFCLCLNKHHIVKTYE